MKSILWIGVIIKSNKIGTYKVVSAAANNWQQNFINGLVENEIKINCITYLPDSYWPKGKLLPKLNENDFPNIENVYTVRYLNVPIFREFSLGLGIIYSILRNRIKLDLLITYNPFKRHIYTGIFIKKVLKKKWALIIADGNKDGNADLDIYLSYDTYINQVGNKILMQGGISDFKIEIQKFIDKKIILYTGNISKLTGIVEFASIFNEIQDDSIELHIYGKGDNQNLNLLSQQNQNIKIFGFVDDETLEKVMHSAWVFVNPRSLSEESIQNTFPSKILEYLRYGKPILSTKSSGISDKYDSFLFYYNSEDLMTLKNLFNYLKLQNEDFYIKFNEEARIFCKQNSWKNVTNMFLNELNHKLAETFF
jgi:glycosyltransferase involved in cell wall biosynthesis